MQLLRIDPPREIQFSGTNFADTTHVTHLTLTNASTTSNVAFKVKTTALKSYLVRPSQNVLKVGETVQIQILLQRLQEVPANHRHRFLVQAAPTSEDTLSSREAWPQIVKDAQVQEFKLSVCFPDVNGKSEAALDAAQSQYTAGDSNRSRDLQSKYEELAEYTKALTERKTELQKEIATLKKTGGPKKGYQFMHLIVITIVVIALLQFYEKMQTPPPPPPKLTVK